MSDLEALLIVGQVILLVLVIYSLLLLNRWQKVWKQACIDKGKPPNAQTIADWKQKMHALPVNSPKWKAYKANLLANGVRLGD